MSYYYANGDLYIDGDELHVSNPYNEHGYIVLDYRRALNIASALLQYATGLPQEEK